MHHNAHHRPKQQQGQALIEAIIGGAVLIALLLLIVILGKYQAVELASVHAARSLAFECAHLPAQCQGIQPAPATVTRWRNRLTGKSPTDFFHAGLWTTREGKPLLEKPSDVKFSIRPESFDATSRLARSGPKPIATLQNNEKLSPGKLLSKLAGPDNFGLVLIGGLLTAQVEIALSKSRGPSDPKQILDGMALTPSAQASILTDFWNASGPTGGAESVQARVDEGRFVNAGGEQVLRAGYFVTKAFMKFMELSLLEDRVDEFKHHEIPMDVVPLDRWPDGQQGAQ